MVSTFAGVGMFVGGGVAIAVPFKAAGERHLAGMCSWQFLSHHWFPFGVGFMTLPETGQLEYWSNDSSCVLGLTTRTCICTESDVKNLTVGI